MGGVANFKFTISKDALGVDPRSVIGRAFVVHNEDGSRAACAILKAVKAVGMVEPYPGTTGPIGGTVSYAYDEEAVVVAGAVSGVEASKSAKDGVANSMGVHIHSGFTCSDAALVGGHYFAAGQTDPWKTVAYTSTSAGTGFFKVLMSAAAMGTTSASTAGRAFIIHNDAGGRIGCVLLGEKQAVTSGGDDGKDGKDDKDDKEDKPKGDGDGKGKGDKSDKDDKPAASVSATFEGATTKYPGTESSSIYGVVAAHASADEL